MKKRDKAIIAFVVIASAVLAAGVFFYEGPGSDAIQSHRAMGSPKALGRHELAATEARAGFSVADEKSMLGQLKSGREREDYLNSLFRTLAASGVGEALAHVRQLPDDESRNIAMLALLGEWSGLSTAELLQQGSLSRYGVAGTLGLYLMGEGMLSPRQTADMANEFLSGSQRADVLGRAAEVLASTDPREALALGDGLTDREQVRFLSRFVSGWASTEPDAARAWVAQMDDPHERAMLMGRIVNEELKANPAVAAQSFAQAPPEDARIRQRVARQIAEGWAGQDTMAAMQWADSLPDQVDRNAAREGISRAAPVGIGARISSGSDGFPVLQELVPGGAASASGQLHPGDRILAVTDASGAWVADSRGMPLNVIVGLIRGEVNTQVSLRVQSPDGSGVREVTLPRAQIINRPGR